MLPTIGSKSWIDSAHGYTQPAQPTTSNGDEASVWRVRPPSVAHEQVDRPAAVLVQLSTRPSSGGLRMSRSQ